MAVRNWDGTWAYADCKVARYLIRRYSADGSGHSDRSFFKYWSAVYEYIIAVVLSRLIRPAAGDKRGGLTGCIVSNIRGVCLTIKSQSAQPVGHIVIVMNDLPRRAQILHKSACQRKQCPRFH